MNNVTKNLPPFTDQYVPVDTGRKWNVHQTFRRRPGRLLNVLCTFSLRPVSTGLAVFLKYSQITENCETLSIFEILFFDISKINELFLILW